MEKTIQRKNAYQCDPRVITVNHEDNPRDDYGDKEQFEALKHSIKTQGLQYPLCVKEVKEDGKLVDIVLTHGFRRMTAIQELLKENPDLETVQTVPVTKDKNSGRAAELIQHAVLNSSKEFTQLEKAKLISELKGLGMKMADIASQIGVSTQTAYNLNRFIGKASQGVIEAVEKGEMSMTTGIHLVDDSKTKDEQNEKLEKAKSSSDGGSTEGKSKTKVKNTDVDLNKRSFGKKAFQEFYEKFKEENGSNKSAKQFYEAVTKEFGFRS